MSYSYDVDLLNIRPQAMSYGIDDFSEFHREAKDTVDRYLASSWYPLNCVINGYSTSNTRFDPALLTNPRPRLRMAASYLALSFIYEFLSKDSEDCPFRAQADRYVLKYNAEIDEVIKAGLEYDWDSVAVLESEGGRPVRRLVRA